LSAIDFNSVRLELGGRTVLRAASFTVAEGEFVGVLGPNGAGKTTLMRAVLGLLAPQAGRIAVLGRAPRRGNPQIGYLPQARGPTPAWLSGRDMVAAVAGGTRWGVWPDRAARAEVARVLELVDATALARRPLGALSGGERQRLLLAQALLGRPRLLLLDEPLAGLDLHRQRAVVALVRRVQQALGIAVLFAAHELAPLIGALDRVLYLGRGEVALGTVAEVVTGPVLSRLYGTPVQVVPVGRSLVVLAEDADAGAG
jgi:zinc/manganese transport system ATP-binding protein